MLSARNLTLYLLAAVATLSASQPGVAAHGLSRRSSNLAKVILTPRFVEERDLFRRDCAANEHACPSYRHGMLLLECVDIQTDSESCGGCTHIQDEGGQDCSTISHIERVQCSAGKCEVLECQDGYKISEDATSCEPSASWARAHKTRSH